MKPLIPDNKGPVSKINNIAFNALIISAGFILLRYSSFCGIIFTDDSFNYYHAAESFLRSGRFISPDNTPFASWPPLFSTVIAVSISTRIISIEVLQYIIYLVNGMLLALLAKVFFTRKAEKYFFLLLILLSVSMIMIHTFLWSEALFLAILLVIIFHTHRLIKDLSWKNILILILLVNILCLQRNAGIFIFLAIILYLIFFTDTGLAKSCSLLFGGAVSFIVWNIYATYIFTDGFNFLEHQYFSGFFMNIKNMADVGSAWFLPRLVPFHIRIIFLAVFLLYLITSGRLKLIAGNREYLLLVILIFVYTGSYAILGRLDFYEIERYLAVLYPFIIMLVIRSLWDLLKYPKIKPVVITVLSLWLAYSVSRAVKNGIDWNDRSCKTEKISVTDNIIGLHSLKNG